MTTKTDLAAPIKTILCLEVGHTRIKAMKFPLQVTSVDDLKEIQTHTALSAPWLNQNLHTLFKKEYGSPLETLLEGQSTQIALSIFGPLYENRFHGAPEKMGVPKNIKEVLEQETGYKFQIECDSIAWAIGALQYLSLKSQKVALPCLVITLGTGPGVALIENENRATAVEIWAMNYPFQN